MALLFESFTSAESLEVCRLLGLNPEGDIITPPLAPPPPVNITHVARKSLPEKSSAATPNRVVAERKRREQLSQRFISLASLIPGLKKMDKGSILEDAMKYTKELNEKIKSLECCLKKEQEEEMSDENGLLVVLHDHQSNMEMRFKESNKKILIRIYCQNGKEVDDIASKMLSYLKTIQLTILKTCFLPFGQHAFDITILAQKMENSNHDISMQELEQKLGEIIQA
ncbi:transcription factor bHLH18-like [Impatiens glandulifera]|uniref:transcription factor bHLH18-like n=1 Tax=Impatiens glandulifera TaxID=253017 RepID=UPI001FB180E0|nr:transcription factor bHLH18-like [Impatiens glandulifera]